MSKITDGTKPPLYTFALFGHRGGGKSCWAVSLAMPQIQHPKGQTVTHIPKPSPGVISAHNRDMDLFSSESSENKKLTDASLKDARDWVKESSRLIRSGGVPGPTPNDILYTFFFRTTSPTQTFDFKLIDYSGELWEQRELLDSIAKASSDKSNKTQLSKAQQARIVLDNVMNIADGIVILADHKQPRQSLGELADDLEAMSSAFDEISQARESQNRVFPPVVIAVNKWDRHYISEDQNKVEQAIKQFNPSEEAKELEVFLNSQEGSPHKNLVNKVRQLVGDESCSVMPVSVFGPSKLVPVSDNPADGVRDVPIKNEILASLNPTDPFVFLAETVAQRAAETAAQTSKHAGLWRYGKYAKDFTQWKKLTARHIEAEPRVKKSSDVFCHRVRRQALVTGLSISLVAAALPSVTMTLMDLQKDRQRITACASFAFQTCSDNKLKEIDVWLEEISNDSNYLRALTHQFVMPREEARKQYDAAQDELAHRESKRQLLSLLDKRRALLGETSQIIKTPAQDADASEVEDVIKDVESLIHDRVLAQQDSLHSDEKSLRSELFNTTQKLNNHQAQLLMLLDSIRLGEAKERVSSILSDGDIASALDELKSYYDRNNGVDESILSSFKYAVKSKLVEQRSTVAELRTAGHRLSEISAIQSVWDGILNHPNLRLTGVAFMREVRKLWRKSEREIKALYRNKLYVELYEVWKDWSPGAANKRAVDKYMQRDLEEYPVRYQEKIKQARHYYNSNYDVVTFNFGMERVTLHNRSCEDNGWNNSMQFAEKQVGVGKFSIENAGNSYTPNGKVKQIELNLNKQFPLHSTFFLTTRDMNCDDEHAHSTQGIIGDFLGERTWTTNGGTFRYTTTLTPTESPPTLDFPKVI